MRRVAVVSVISVTLVALSATSPARAADYYVSPTGNDGNSGTSPAQAWLTIQRAYTEPVAPGDTVHVADGTYVGWATDISGTPSAPITWKAEGANVIVNAPVPGGPGNPSDNIRLMYANYNIIDGFQSTTAPRAGIAVRGDDTTPIVGCIVRNCNSHDNQTWGLFDAFANSCTYEYNICSGSIDQHGIYHSNSGDDCIIRYNTCFNNGACGLHNNGDISQGGDGICSRLLIEGNVLYGNGALGGASINMDGVQDSIIRNNLIYEVGGQSGIIAYQIDAAAPATGNTVVNNTVIMEGSSGRWALSFVNGSASGSVAFNNVLYRDHAFRGSINVDSAGLTSDYNVVVDRFSTDDGNTNMTLAQWQAQTGNDMNSILIDPSTLGTFFVNPGASDYHLATGSPAIDAGVATLSGRNAPSTDFETDARPQGAGFDIGCDEYQQATGPTADFSGTPLSGPAPLNVAFTDLSTGGVTTWSWTFGDGGTSAQQNPAHTYNAIGSYDVSLTVTSPGGSDTNTKVAYITVTGGNPVANFVTGKGRGLPNDNQVAIHSLGGTQQQAWLAYAAGQWGTLVSSGDIDASGLSNPLTGPGPGPVYGPQVKAFQTNGTPISKVNFYAYGTLRYGVNVAGVLLDADASAEILSGAGPGPVFGPHVRGWNYDGVALAAINKISFFAFSTLKYGVNVGGSDVENDGFQEILAGPGPSGAFGAQVRGFNYDGASVSAIAKINFTAFPSGAYGVNVGGGEVDGDPFEEIVVARGPATTQATQIRGYNYDGSAIALLPGFDVTPFPTNYGARAATGDIDGTGHAELVAGPGEDPAAAAAIRSYNYNGSALVAVAAGNFTPFTSSYGCVVGAGVFGY